LKSRLEQTLAQRVAALTVTLLRNLLYFFNSSLSDVFFRFCIDKYADQKCHHGECTAHMLDSAGRLLHLLGGVS
jgi:hypothetical protein